MYDTVWRTQFLSLGTELFIKAGGKIATYTIYCIRSMQYEKIYWGARKGVIETYTKHMVVVFRLPLFSYMCTLFVPE